MFLLTSSSTYSSVQPVTFKKRMRTAGHCGTPLKTIFILYFLIPMGGKGPSKVKCDKPQLLQVLSPTTRVGVPVFLLLQRERLVFTSRSRMAFPQMQWRYVVYLTNFFSKPPPFQTGEGVVIVDAGGGTLDISAYSKSSNGVTDSFEEISAPQCETFVICTILTNCCLY